ncbi:MAG TPA: hypothetical protein VHU40_20525, partial [Polyangia bacterium]|nr:hypothetical protein [Polyangia bacterium]
MTCFLCHGGADPADGHVVLGMAGRTFDYGLLLATAALLEDGGGPAAYRRAHGFPDGATVRARLLLAGPGRQDLTGEFGLDVTVPGTHSMRYPGTRRVRQGVKGIVNPISVPPVLPWAGVDLQNWSGSEVASARWLTRLITLAGTGADAVLARLDLPRVVLADARAPSAAATRRALLLDLRNLGTLGLQQDSYPGLLWADAIYGNATLDAAALTAIPPMYGAGSIRRVLADEVFSPARSSRDAVARGRDIFANRIVGVVANRQVLKEAPAAYAPAKLTGPLLAPLDEALPATFAVRCADCHSATPGGEPQLLSASNAPPLGRCGHCHRAHAPFEDDAADTTRVPLAKLNVPVDADEERARCMDCHTRHRPFAPVVYSSSVLLPFDANGNGKAQDDEDADARAGGIGTEALLAFDVPKPERGASGFSLPVPSLARLHGAGPVETVRLGAGWVRVPPLSGVRASAPYLHNGSVPTLRALLDPARRRPVTFALGTAGFVFDTRLPGNRNIGHEYGVALTEREKADLIAFLE